MGRLPALLALFICVLATSGCATYSSSFAKIEQQLAKQQYDDALKTLEEQADDRKDHVLYLLNKGMVQRMKGEFATSNQSLEAAKQEMERLYAASVSEHAMSFVINDATVSYAGDDYEQVLVHLYMALNYLELGERDEARVEALQVDIKLREIAEKFPESKFTEDALSRYLTGLIYEDLGEWSDAMIAYRKAYEAYKQYQEKFSVTMPTVLKHDLVRLARRQGLNDELARYRREFDLPPEQDEPAAAGPESELVFVLNSGLAPIKREKVISTWAPAPHVTGSSRRSSKTTYVSSKQQESPSPPVLVHIALPYYESRRNMVAGARVRVADRQADTQMMEDIDAIARASLEARMGAITARAIARAIAKGAIQESVDRAGQKSDDAAAKLVGSLLVRVAAIATERADTRSWLTLPANVQLARLPLQPGQYDVTIELLGNHGQVVETRTIPQVTIRKTRKTYLTAHSMPY